MATPRTIMRPFATAAPAGATGINPAAMLLVMLAITASLFTANPLSSLVGVFGLLVLFKFFWTRTQPAVLFLALLHQWLQVNAGLLYADVFGLDHSEFFTYREYADEAYFLGMSSLFALGFGLWLMTRDLSKERLDSWLDRLDPLKCLKLYVTFNVTFSVICTLPLPGLGQAIMALSFLKWGFFYIFFSAVLHTGRYRLSLIIFMVLEFVFSLYSIFASFRAILIMPIMLLPVFFKGRIRFVHLLVGLLLSALLINVAIVWTAVKQDYRAFMAQGQKGQFINVSRDVALAKLGDLVKNVDGNIYEGAELAMVRRIFYLDLLSGVMKNVTATLPHESGANSMKSILHIVTPRFLFPEKEAIHDAVQLNKYMGRYIADYRTTSMSIGYVGDFYIDFGFYAPLAVFVLGLINGYFYRMLYRQDPVGGWGLFFAMPLFFTFYVFEITLIKMFGMMVTYVLVMLLVSRFLLPYIKRKVTLDVVTPQGGSAHVNPRRVRIA